ncbi:MAG: serine/threonine-protein kinase [Planctomycetota bacterium]
MVAPQDQTGSDTLRHDDGEVDEFLIEFLNRRASGDSPSKEEYLRRLDSDSKRQEFLELLDQALRFDSLLPFSYTPGDTFEHFRIEEFLGQGGMGVVYRVFDTDLERRVALKVLPPEYSLDATYRDRFEHEAKLLAQLQHPNIVAIHEAKSCNDFRYLVMDLVDGDSLHEVLRRLRARDPRHLTAEDLEAAIKRPAPAGRESLIDTKSYYKSVARIMRDVVRAVEAAHGQQVLHHDIKPRNIMLTGGGHPVVLDFGLARSSRLRQERPLGGGTLPYLAPEQLKSQESPGDPRTDIFQLGLTLYEMLTLHRAREGKTPEDIRRRIERADFALPRHLSPSIPRDLEAICLKALASDPERRYATTREMGNDLEHWLQGLPTVARPPGPLRYAGYLARRHRVAAAAFVALALGIVPLGLAYWLSSPDVEMRWIAVVPPAWREWRELVPGQAVEPGQILGLDLTLDKGAALYAVSLSGSDIGGAPEAVTRLDLMLVESDPQAPASGETHAFLEFPRAGTYRVLLSTVDPPADSESSTGFEGLWVFVAAKPQEWLEAWLDRVASVEQMTDTDKVPYSVAHNLLAEALEGKSRGSSLERLPVEERRRLASELFGVTKKELELGETRLFHVRFPVAHRAAVRD